MSLQAPPPPPVWSDTQPGTAPVAVAPPAGFWIRFVAFLIDALILMVIAGVIIGVAGAIAALGMGLDHETSQDAYAVLIGIGVILAVIALIVITMVGARQGRGLGGPAASPESGSSPSPIDPHVAPGAGVH